MLLSNPEFCRLNDFRKHESANIELGDGGNPQREQGTSLDRDRVSFELFCRLL